uniref:Uncharacterized protein n=1 Tax=Branchiostoma floridae TaxID=7739 RepID=C3ZKF5_BRAFL|eukprot:XP_002591043.1 hypothetical protein BRAFLDRAFT_69404 [Branchiostoma floridae]
MPQPQGGRSPPSTERAISPGYRQGDRPQLPAGRSPPTTSRAINYPKYSQGDQLPQVLTGRSTTPSTHRAIAPNYRQGDHPRLPTGRSPRTTGRAIAPKYPSLL